MKFMIVVAFALLAAVSAKPYEKEFVLKGPSGIVTSKGPIGPTGPATGGDGKWDGDGGYYGGDGGYGGEGKWGGDDGYYGGDGEWDDGDDGSYKGEGAGYGGYSGAVYGDGVKIIAPGAAAAVVAGPAKAYGGWGAGYAAYGGYDGGYGGYDGGYAGYGGYGVAIKGPKTVPALVAGPAGKIVADGLYGVPAKKYY